MHRKSTKNIPVFLPAGGVYWSLLLSFVSLLSSGTVQSEATYLCTLKNAGQVWKSQKG